MGVGGSPAWLKLATINTLAFVLLWTSAELPAHSEAVSFLLVSTNAPYTDIAVIYRVILYHTRRVTRLGKGRIHNAVQDMGRVSYLYCGSSKLIAEHSPAVRWL